MTHISLTNEQARRFLLAYQGLRSPRMLEGKSGIMEFVRRVGCIQFDPLDVVGRNPDLVLQSRIAGFRPAMLEELLYRDRELLDGYDKMMALYPVADLPYFVYRQREAARHSRRRDTQEIRAVLPEIRREIEQRGPLSSIDLDHDRKVDWPWGPTRLAKVALEDMHYAGELVVHHKEGTRKVYDLASRCIPSEILDAPDPHETMDDYHDWHVLRRIGGIGLTWNRGSAIWYGIYGAETKERTAALLRLLTRKQIIEVRVDGMKYPLYMRSRDLHLLDSLRDRDVPESAAIIAPLDNLIWERDLVRALFGFDYTWEVYKPVEERKYGYYVLPVVYGDRFVARFEPARDKKTGVLDIKNWWWEPDVKVSPEMHTALKECFERFLGYLDLKKIKVRKSLVTREKINWLP